MITPEQMRMARAGLGWTQGDVAQATGLTELTVSNLEKGITGPSAKSARALERTYGEYYEFLPGGGLEKRQERIITYSGHEGFVQFMRDVHHTCATEGGDVFVSNVEEKLFEKWLGNFLWEYVGMMNSIPKERFWFKIIVNAEDAYAPARYADYRWLPSEYYTPVPAYIYGNKLAIIVFDEEENDVRVFVHHHTKIVEAFRKQFLFAWKYAKKLRKTSKTENA